MQKETPRTWHSGPPPHVGWWNASVCRDNRCWRWWDGVQWSESVRPDEDAEKGRIHTRGDNDGFLWSDYYPENARVPRVDPNNRWIAPLLPGLNAGSLFTWMEAGQRMREPDPTPEEDEAWRAFSTGQRTGPAAQNPGARDLAEVSTRDLMTELFRRIG